jgi:putative transposase
MNAFWASENFDAFIVFHSSRPRPGYAENSSLKRSSLMVPHQLVTAIATSFKASDRTYGARWVWHDVIEAGLLCGLQRIERLMRQNALKARPKRRGKPQDDGERSLITDNILDRDFEADRPNQKWPADFTYIWTTQGWLYVAVVLDLFSRRTVGRSMKAERDATLAMDALMMAVWRRGKADALLHQLSDQKIPCPMAHQNCLLSLGLDGHEPRSASLNDPPIVQSAGADQLELGCTTAVQIASASAASVLPRRTK